MARVYLFIFCTVIISCKNRPARIMTTLEKDGLTIKGYTIRDSIFDDTVYYFSDKNVLIRKDLFKEGKINGTSVDYSDDGKPKRISYYENGLLNGYNTYYDSSGKCYYKDFYYHNLIVGPIVYYTNDEGPKRFFFVNLQNETLLDIDYKKWNGIHEIVPKCINYVYNIQRRDSTNEYSLLLYIMNPPKLSFSYKILKIRKNDNSSFAILEKFESDMPFSNITLPNLTDSFYYAIQLSVYDSILAKKTIINKEIF